jgi:hypothetical protein
MMLCLGDSIAHGVAQPLKCHFQATDGASHMAIASWNVPAGYDTIVISAGTNPGGKTQAQVESVRGSLEAIAKKCGNARLVWILPHFIPEAAVVAKFARERGEPGVSFKCTSGFHPDNGYAALARDIIAALG